MEKLLKLDRPVVERFYALYREQFNPDLTVPTWSSKNGFPWERLEQRNHRQAATGRRLDVCGKSPTLIINSKEPAPKAQYQKALDPDQSLLAM